MKQSDASAQVFAPPAARGRAPLAQAGRALCGFLALLPFAAAASAFVSPAVFPPLFVFYGFMTAALSGLAVLAAAAVCAGLRAGAGKNKKLRALKLELGRCRQIMAAAAPPGGAAALPAAQAEALLDAAQTPLWLRAADGEIIFANAACAALAAAHDGADKNGRNAARFAGRQTDIEALFGSAPSRAWRQARQKRQNFEARANLALKGDRHIFLCRSVWRSPPGCFAESAEDITERQMLRENAARVKRGYAETLDRLSTAVAIFDPGQRLEFFNSAFAALWPLETAFLESAPSHALLLDRLREKGILNERPDWRAWQEELFAAYHLPEPQHYIWNLPDGRTLRVVASPHPQGGVAWLFDDLTEKLALQARYDTLIRMQGETLDSLAEGVAVFAANGRLRLVNPAFAALWNLPAELVIEETHIERIKRFCGRQSAAPLAADGQAEAAEAPDLAGAGKAEPAAASWEKIALYITAFAEKRDIAQGRAELSAGRVYDYSLAPLPQGQTMLSFADVTDSVHIARALRERNAALESADRLRNAFIRHVSYELRTPLTNIMGFTDLLSAHIYGALNEKQSDYLRDIAAQSQILLNLVNNILDLATVDAGGAELNLSAADARESMESAAALARPALAAKNVTAEITVGEGVAAFQADKARLQQIFVNLLKNAAQAAKPDSRIRFNAAREGSCLAFSVEDEGEGIDPARRADIFKPFTAYAAAGQKTGAGLGLAIVKSFVELHQGHVELAEGARGGAKFICRFPCPAPAERALQAPAPDGQKAPDA